MDLSGLVGSPNNDGLDPEAETARSLLQAIQGNILKHHGRGFALHVLITFRRDPKSIAAALDWLANGSDPTSAYVQSQSKANKKFLFRSVALSKSGYEALGIPDEDQPRDPVFQRGAQGRSDHLPVGWGYTGRLPGLEPHFGREIDALVILAHDDEKALQREYGRLESEIGSFADVALNADLGNPAAEPGHLLWMSGDGGGPVEGPKPAKGKAWPIEYFGYADGASQPRFLKNDVDSERRRNAPGDKIEPGGAWEPGAPLNLVLAEDQRSGYGSYLAFLKYEQDLEGFHRAVASLSDQMVIDALAEALCADLPAFLSREGITEPLTDPFGRKLVSFCSETLKCAPHRAEACGDERCERIGICGEHVDHLKERADFAEAMRATRQFGERRRELDIDRLYALVVGRYRDGRPLIRGATARSFNDFDFGSDPDGVICPFHAHIRRMNPRGELRRLRRENDERYSAADTAAEERRYRIARRGMPYKHQTKDGETVHGLYFMSYQSALETLELLLDAADDGGFVQTGYDASRWPGAPVGMDPIVGQHPAPADQTWPRLGGAGTGEAQRDDDSDRIPVTRFRLSHYVTLRGGGYFYAPSIEYLKKIEAYSRVGEHSG